VLIIIEGIDAAGKATQAKMLTDHLGGLPRSLLVSFPRYETPLGKAILRHLKSATVLVDRDAVYEDYSRGAFEGFVGAYTHIDDPMMFQCMMSIDKYMAAPHIEAANKLGMTVICDRYWPSAVAYGSADGLDTEWLKRIHTFLPQPDLAILIDVTEEEAYRRGIARGGDPDRYERNRAKQAKVRANYLELWAGQDDRWVVVNGNGLQEDVAELIRKQLP
jgi:dTMP kinase